MLTTRGWALLGAAVGGLLLAVFTLNLLPMAIALFAVGFVGAEVLAFEVTARRLAPGSFAAERTDRTGRLHADGLGATAVRIRRTGDRPFYLRIEDSTPTVFEVVEGSPRLETWWSDQESLTLGYVFRARTRGEFTIGPTEIVLQDPLGLAFRRIRLATQASVLVSPAAPEVSLRRSAFRLTTQTMGFTPVARRGYGTEFRSLRPYQLDDDYRTISWRRSQGGSLFVREFEQESRQDFLVVISLAPEMAAGDLGETALDRACEAGILLATYAPRGGDRVGLLLAGPQGPETYLPPDRGSFHALKIAEALGRAMPKSAGPTLDSLIRVLPVRLRQPTHVFLFAPLPAQITGPVAGLGTFLQGGHRLYYFPPDTARMHAPFADPTAQAYLDRAVVEEGRRTRERQRVLERLGILVAPYDREGAGSRLLSLYQQIHVWGVGR